MVTYSSCHGKLGTRTYDMHMLVENTIIPDKRAELRYTANETRKENSVSNVHHLCTNPTVKLADPSN